MNPGITNRYPLTFSNVIRHAATVMDMARSEGRAMSIEDIARDYDHSPVADLVRVRRFHGLATDTDAIRFLFKEAIESLGDRVEQVDGGYRLAKPLTRIRYPKDAGSPGTRIIPVDLSKPVLGDPFNPMSGRYSDNVRRNSGKDSLDALRESMRRAGWLPYHPAIKDERGVVLVGHRRLSVAQELGIPVREGVEIQTIQFGRGDYADLRRSFLAFFSNEGGRPFAPEDRKDIARHLYLDNDLTEAQIADLLGVSQQTVARDLASTHVSTRRGGGRPRNVLDPVHASTLTPDQRQTVHRLGEEGKTIAVITKAVGTSEMPVRAEINRERGRRESTVTHVSDSLHGCLAPGCDHGKTDV